MKEKEIDELLDSLKEIITKASKIPTEEEVKKKFNEALKEPCKILIETKNENTRMNIEGGRLTILLTIAGAEKGILNQLECSKDEFEFIKKIVGVENEDEDMEVE